MTINIPLSVPFLNGRELEYLSKCITDNWVSTAGEYVDKFEDMATSYTGVKYAIAVNSGTSALHLALIALNVGEGDEVIVPTVTFIASINPVSYVGAKPIFMDCDNYLNIDPVKVVHFIENECMFDGEKLTNNKTKRTVKAIIVVHVFGCPVNIAPLIKVAKKYNVMIIEDAAESIGSSYKDGYKKTGSIGDIAFYSFNGNKMITAGGGGMVLTNNVKLASRCKYLSTQAKDDGINYIHNEIGYNYRMTNVHAAIGVAQLEKIDEFIEIKARNLKVYRECLEGIEGIRILDNPEWGVSNNWFYSLVLSNYKKTRNELIKIFDLEGIQTRPLWQPNHLQLPYTSCQAYKIENALKYHRKIINLPCSIDLKESDIRKVSRIVSLNA